MGIIIGTCTNIKLNIATFLLNFYTKDHINEETIRNQVQNLYTSIQMFMKIYQGVETLFGIYYKTCFI